MIKTIQSKLLIKQVFTDEYKLVFCESYGSEQQGEFQILYEDKKYLGVIHLVGEDKLIWEIPQDADMEQVEKLGNKLESSGKALVIQVSEGSIFNKSLIHKFFHHPIYSSGQSGSFFNRTYWSEKHCPQCDIVERDSWKAVANIV